MLEGRLNNWGPKEGEQLNVGCASINFRSEVQKGFVGSIHTHIQISSPFYFIIFFFSLSLSLFVSLSLSLSLSLSRSRSRYQSETCRCTLHGTPPERPCLQQHSLDTFRLQLRHSKLAMWNFNTFIACAAQASLRQASLPRHSCPWGM